MILPDPPDPPDPGDPVLTVDSISLRTIKASRGNKFGVADVRITNGQGSAVSGALVDGFFTGVFSDTFTGRVTDGSGVATFQTGAATKGGFGFCVTKVTSTGLADWTGLVCGP